MRNLPGYVFCKRYTHRALTLRKWQQLEAAIDALVDRWIIEKRFEVTDGKVQIKSESPSRQS